MTVDPPGAVDGGRKRHGDLLSVARGAGLLATGGLFSYVVRLVMAVLLANWLGADDYGLYILAVSVAFAASGLASLGLHTAMERYVAVTVRRGDSPGTLGALQVGFIGTVTAGIVLAILLGVFSDSVARSLFDEPRLESLLHLSAVMTSILGLSTFLLSSLRGFKRMDRASLADNVVQPVSRFVVLLIMAVVGITAFRAGVAIAFSYAVSTALLIRFVSQEISLTAGWRTARRDVRGIAAFALPFWFSGVLRVVRTRLQPILLGVFGSTANVGVFTVVTSANMLGRLANASIRAALRPTLAELHDIGDTDEVGRLYATTTRWTLAASLPVFLMMVLVPESLLAVFGPRFTDGTSALVIVACAELVNAATGMCGPIIAMSGHNKLKMVNSFVWVSVSLLTNVVMIPLWGVVGAGVAILISTAVINLVRVVELWLLMKVLPWDRRTWKPVAAAAATGAIGYLALRPLPDELGPVLLAAFAVGLGAVFAGLFVAVGLEADDRLVLGRVRATVGGRVKRGRSGGMK